MLYNIKAIDIITELMKISFHESQVDIICDWFNDSSKIIISPMQKKYL